MSRLLLGGRRDPRRGCGENKEGAIKQQGEESGVLGGAGRRTAAAFPPRPLQHAARGHVGSPFSSERQGFLRFCFCPDGAADTVGQASAVRLAKADGKHLAKADGADWSDVSKDGGKKKEQIIFRSHYFRNKTFKLDSLRNPPTLLEVNPVKGHLVSVPSHNATPTEPPGAPKVRWRVQIQPIFRAEFIGGSFIHLSNVTRRCRSADDPERGKQTRPLPLTDREGSFSAGPRPIPLRKLSCHLRSR